jgi:hypothetical protein
MYDENKDERLFNEFISAHQQMDISKVGQCVQSMSDEGLFDAAFKIDDLAKSDPGFMICNTILFSEFTKRPHLRNPFLG